MDREHLTSRRRALALLGAGAAALGVSGARADAQTPVKVRIATLPIEAGAEAFYGTDLGFFAKAGLDVETDVMSNGDAVAAAVASNAVDVAYADSISVATAFGKGIPLVAVAPAALYTASAPTTALMVRRDSPLRTAKDLGGKIVAATALGTISGIGVRNWIDRNGGDSSTVKLVELGFPAMQPALASGRIDAAMIAEPFLTRAKAQDRVLAQPYDAIAKEFAIGVWVTTPQWARAHPDVLARFTGAVRAIADWANGHHDESAKVLERHTKITAETAATMVRARYGATLTTAMLQPAIDAAARYGKFAPYRATALMVAAR